MDFVSLILYVLSTYYLPLATGIVARGDLARLRSFYATVTKWGIVLAGPLLAALVVAPGPLLELLFGPRYGGSQAVAIARILSVGYAVTLLMGLNGVNLVALGATKASRRQIFSRVLRQHPLERGAHFQVRSDRRGDRYVHGLRWTQPRKFSSDLEAWTATPDSPRRRRGGGGGGLLDDAQFRPRFLVPVVWITQILASYGARRSRGLPGNLGGDLFSRGAARGVPGVLA